MGAFGLYLIKASVGLILFYLFFKVLMSRDTFFHFNRFVLLAGVVFCVVLPFLRIETKGEPTYVQGRFLQLEAILQQDGSVVDSMEMAAETRVVRPVVVEKVREVKEEKEEKAGGWGMVCTVGLYFSGLIYGVGCFILLVGLVMAYVKMVRLIRAGRKIKHQHYTLVLSGQTICPFNWGKYIVISENDYHNNCREVLAHEKAHLDKRHTIDLVFMELYIVFFWFNPAVWLLKKELQEIHEYEADNGVINQGIDATKYQLLLVKKAVGARLYSIANSFNHSKLKNRITMMLKEKSNQRGRLKALLFVLPAALLMFAFARPETGLIENSPPVSDVKVTQISEDNPKVWTKSYFAAELKKNLGNESSVVNKKVTEWKKDRIVSIIMDQKIDSVKTLRGLTNVNVSLVSPSRPASKNVSSSSVSTQQVKVTAFGKKVPPPPPPLIPKQKATDASDKRIAPPPPPFIPKQQSGKAVSSATAEEKEKKYIFVVGQDQISTAAKQQKDAESSKGRIPKR